MRVAHNKLDLSGMKFGRLTALHEEGRNKHGWVLWRFSCDCGNETVAVGFHVKAPPYYQYFRDGPIA